MDQKPPERFSIPESDKFDADGNPRSQTELRDGSVGLYSAKEALDANQAIAENQREAMGN